MPANADNLLCLSHGLSVAYLRAAFILIFISSATAVAENPIQKENKLPGAIDWQLTRVKVDAAGCRSMNIEGYCSKQSVQPGESMDIMVSSTPARDFKLEFFRTGYYGGRGARLMKTIAQIGRASCRERV